jgi:hypothetical protein
MAKKKNKKRYKTPLGYSPVQATASGAGVHEKIGKHRRRDERRKAKQDLRKDDLE